MSFSARSSAHAALPACAAGRGAGLQAVESSVRRYSGEHQSHAHGHAQILYALHGRMELEVQGHSSYVDTACGMVIPAGVLHGYVADPRAQLLVMDVPAGTGLDKARRFAVPAALRAPALARSPVSAATQLALVLQAPSLLQRRALDVAWLAQQVQAALHADWPTARMAQLCHLSVAQFHARFVELQGTTPQAWVRGLRLDAATQLLARGITLEASALQCGYRSASALAYALRRERQVRARSLRAP